MEPTTGAPRRALEDVFATLPTHGSASPAPDTTDPAPIQAPTFATAPVGRLFASTAPSPVPMQSMLSPSLAQGAAFHSLPPATPWSPPQAPTPTADILGAIQQAPNLPMPSYMTIPSTLHAFPPVAPQPYLSAPATGYASPIGSILSFGYDPYGYGNPIMPRTSHPAAFDAPFSPPRVVGAPALAPPLLPTPGPVAPSLIGPPQGAAAPTKVPKELTTGEIQAYKTNLERVGLKSWLERFVYLMENKHPMLRFLLQYPLEQAKQMVAQDPSMQQADAYLARQIDCVLDHGADRVKAFRAKLDHSREISRSGVLKLAHIRRLCVLVHGAEAHLAELEFDKKTFFRMNMSRSEAIAKAYALATEFELLARYTGEISIMFEILKKMPNQLITEINHLSNELSHGMVRRVMPYDLEQFIEIVAIHLSGHGGIGGNLHGRSSPRKTNEIERAQSDDGRATASGVKCVACGEAGHHVRECTKKCPMCQLKPCPGTYGQPCVVNTTRDVPKEVKNALGHNIPEPLRRVLVQ